MERDLDEPVEAESLSGFVSIWNLCDLLLGELGGPRVQFGRKIEKLGTVFLAGSELSYSCK